MRTKPAGHPLRALRTEVTERIEPLRRDKIVGSSLEAEVWVPSDEDPAARGIVHHLDSPSGDWKVMKTENHKCARCWRHLPDVDPAPTSMHAVPRP